MKARNRTVYRINAEEFWALRDSGKTIKACAERMGATPRGLGNITKRGRT